MGVERQQRKSYQRSLFEAFEGDHCHGESGSAASRSGVSEAKQSPTAGIQKRTLDKITMEEVANLTNLEIAKSRVKDNKGSPGIDGMTVGELDAWMEEHGKELSLSLLSETYRPSRIRGVTIPKRDGGERQLGIPTVVDRLVQQAILRLMNRDWDREFSKSSYGFRPKRSALDAVRQASKYVAEGRTIVVDVDLEKFFDRVNHDILMSRLSHRISDRRVLRLIRRFLEAGMMQDGVVMDRDEGTPQGGPLSPFLANVMLDDLDQELERRGHSFCRYADDCNIYVYSQEAGERVMASVTRFLEEVLKLRVNAAKSAVSSVEERKFLGYQITEKGQLTIAPKSLERARERIRELSSRNRGVSFGVMLKSINRYLSGWIAYFRENTWVGTLKDLDGWIRRKLRCARLKMCKTYGTMQRFLVRQGISSGEAWYTVLNRYRWWRMSRTKVVNRAMSNDWFQEIGLMNLKDRHAYLNQPEPPDTSKRTSGGVGDGEVNSPPTRCRPRAWVYQ